MLVNTSYAATVREFELGVKFLGTPYYYDGAFYGHNNRGKISQMNTKGQSVWELDHTSSSWEFLGIKFNQIFVLDTKKNLHVIDAKRGYKKFSPHITPVKDINLRYPIIPIRTQNNEQFAIDFFTGNVVQISPDKWTRLMTKKAPKVTPSDETAKSSQKLLNENEKTCTLRLEQRLSDKTSVVLCQEAVYWVIR